MDQEPQTYRFQWRGIEIEAIYTPLKWGVTAHLEIRSIRPERARLPITETGYRSHFYTPGTVQPLGGDVVAQVIAWLDEEATRPAWRTYAEANRQGDLFG
ncbi:hypothetical protein [Sphingomonas sp. BE137]|jgi:hypothetical protein|uniref:hypothetical protein n=1 Tax=Sphingomonas sp. BE137 TaxID=2817844 RepID=UPI001AE67FA3|nr:hypothetical protein [Sphingomonas sp. BE137]MDR6849725.1 hypothetical protein [Sphingomonas sp. BE137]